MKKEKNIGPRVCPRSSPLFQEFKVWQTINNIFVNGAALDDEDKSVIAKELMFRDKLKDRDLLKLLFKTTKGLSVNFKEVDGNRTMATLMKACVKIAENLGYDDIEFSKLSSEDQKDRIEEIFKEQGFKTGFLHFDSSLASPEFEHQDSYRLWHLLYSYEGDKSASGDESLVKCIMNLCSMDEGSAKILASCKFLPDYGSLSAKAMRKILPYMKDGLEYSAACVMPP